MLLTGPRSKIGMALYLMMQKSFASDNYEIEVEAIAYQGDSSSSAEKGAMKPLQY